MSGKLKSNISDFLPQKKNWQTNSNNNYDRFNNYCFQLCEIIDNKCIKLDMGEEIYVKILGYLHSQKWNKIIQNNCKHYYYNDLQLIIYEYGDQWCKKDKIFGYNSRLDTIQATVANYKMKKKLDNITSKRIKNAYLFDSLLKYNSNISLIVEKRLIIMMFCDV